MSLTRFLTLVRANDQELAEAIGVQRTTIWRIRTGRVIPRSSTVAAILRWAEERARLERLPVQDRLTWSALLDGAQRERAA